VKLPMCLLFHKWEQSRPVSVYDIMPFGSWKTPVRYCRRCGKQEYWLPGYGGSEIGCWMKAK